MGDEVYESFLDEQAMEAEALTAIFEDLFVVERSVTDDNKDSRNVWSMSIYPETATDDEERDQLNHVAVTLRVSLPLDYPEGLDGQGRVPDFEINIRKGLIAETHGRELLDLAQQEAAAQCGVPSVFAVAERVRDWLMEHNQAGLDDVSMHAQMLQRQKKQQQEAVKAEQRTVAQFESHASTEEMTEAEKEELLVRKRRAEGTPCTKESFDAWQRRFDAEMEREEQEQLNPNIAAGGAGNRNSTVVVDKSGRLTGYQYFQSKANQNLEALEAAALQAAENGELDDDDEEAVQDAFVAANANAELFLVDDEDLDDLDFDDDEEEDVDI